ncbi:MAG: IS66 family transposase [Candidatus Omnitrophota bacterium]
MGRFKNNITKSRQITSFGSYCEGCLQKQCEIDRLKELLESANAKLKYREEKDNQPFFGSSTPSSKLPVKENTLEENRKKRGGAKPGHKGNGRERISKDNADRIIERPVKEVNCPLCGGELEHKDTTWRSVIDSFLNKAQRLLYMCEIKECKECHKTFSNKPLILPKNKYGNNLICNSAIMHYFHGIPLKRLETLWGENVVAGNLIKSFHRLAKFWKPVIEELKTEYRKHPVKHADETGWRTDGKSGYAWLFAADDISIFAFRETRSSSVAKEILGTKKLRGVLVVDRYAAYNKSPCSLQYCYAHLLRGLEDVEKDFPDVKEIQRFVSCLAPLLAKAMHLRAQPIPDKKYYRQAKILKREIQKLARAPAEHPAIQNYQDIFKEKKHRLYHWVLDRRVPAENNRAERELRPTVIARKVSFGSQSENGAATRSVLMSILHTAAKRLKKQSLEEWFLWTLEEFAKNPNVDPFSLLPTSK